MFRILHSRPGVSVALAFTVLLVVFSAAPSPARAQSRVRVSGGLGLAGGSGELGRLTGLGMSGTLAVGLPVDERIAVWFEGSADGLSGADGVDGDTEYMTRYLATGEYRITWPWSAWRVSATLGAGATTFWDNSWATYELVNDNPVEPLHTTTIVAMSGTHFTVAPGLRASYSVDPNLDIEFVGRYSLALYDGESFRIDEVGGLTVLEPPGSPITSWAFTLGGRLRTGGPPSAWADLEPGDPVRVWGANGRQYDGRLVSVDESRLRLNTESGITDMGWTNVQSAAALNSRADRGSLIGGVALGVLGFGLGYLAGQGLCDKADCSGEGVGPGIGLGLIAGIGGFVFGGLIGGGSESWHDIGLP